MKTPSLRNFKVVPFQISSAMMCVRSDHLINAMEFLAHEQLQPKEAAVGNYMVEAYQEGRPPLLGQYWIMRHNDYDTGRPRIEIQLRETLQDEIFVWHSNDDRLMKYKILDSMLYEEYVRVTDEPGWFKTFHLEYKHFSLEAAPPAIREPELFDQCREMGKTLSAWLSSNLTVIFNRGEEPTELSPALSRFLKYNIVDYALTPEFYDQSKAYLNDPSLPDPRTRELFGEPSRVRGRLRRSNRIATTEQHELHKRLKASCEYINGLDPSERPIHISNLLGLQTRWLNEFREPIQSYLK